MGLSFIHLFTPVSDLDINIIVWFFFIISDVLISLSNNA